MLLHLSRIAGRQTVVGYVFRHHRTSPNDAPFAYLHAGTYYHSASQPRVVAYLNGVGRLAGAAPLHIVEGVLRRVELAVGTNLHVTSYAHPASVEDGAVVVKKRAFTYGDAVAMVAVKRRADG